MCLLVTSKKSLGRNKQMQCPPLGLAALPHLLTQYLPFYMACVDISFPLMYQKEMSGVHLLRQKKLGGVSECLCRGDEVLKHTKVSFICPNAHDCIMLGIILSKLLQFPPPP